MKKYSIVLIKWNILNQGKIERKMCLPKNGYNGESPLYIGIGKYIERIVPLTNYLNIKNIVILIIVFLIN